MIVALSVCAMLGSTPAAAEERAPSLEHQVKAAFLYNFTRFAEWPADIEGAEEFVIGVLGSNGIEQALVRALANRTHNGRPFRVRHLESFQDLRGCQIVFFAGLPVSRQRALLAALRGQPVLTVGEAEDFAAAGGVIGFFTDEGKLHFEVNTDAAARSRIRLSSKLLALAVIVHERAR